VGTIELLLNECYNACEEAHGLTSAESAECFDACDEEFPLEEDE
jgi:hypothetical protein